MHQEHKIGADDKVVMVGYYQGTNKATGNPFKAIATQLAKNHDELMSI